MVQYTGYMALSVSLSACHLPCPCQDAADPHAAGHHQHAPGVAPLGVSHCGRRDQQRAAPLRLGARLVRLARRRRRPKALRAGQRLGRRQLERAAAVSCDSARGPGRSRRVPRALLLPEPQGRRHCALRRAVVVPRPAASGGGRQLPGWRQGYLDFQGTQLPRQHLG